jgi:hypothetical protein
LKVDGLGFRISGWGGGLHGLGFVIWRFVFSVLGFGVKVSGL